MKRCRGGGIISGYWLEVLTHLSIMAIVAVGFYVTSMTGQLSLGHAAFMGIGGYVAGSGTLKLGLPFPVALLLGALAAALVGALFAALALRLRYFFLAVASLGLGEFMVVVFYNSGYFGGAEGLQGIPIKGGLVTSIVALIAVALVVRWLEDTRLGQAFRAIRDDELAAASLGLNARLLRVASFTLGAAVAGLGGGLFAHFVGIVQPTDLGFQNSLWFLAYATMGGLGTVWGALLGTFGLGILAELLRFSLYDRYLLFGLLLLITMVVRPGGILKRRPILSRRAEPPTGRDREYA